MKKANGCKLKNQLLAPAPCAALEYQEYPSLHPAVRILNSRIRIDTNKPEMRKIVQTAASRQGSMCPYLARGGEADMPPSLRLK